MWNKFGVYSLATLLLGACIYSYPVAAVGVPSSTNYRFDESSIGTNSLLDSSSTNYRATTGAGDTAAGFSASSNFQTQAGSNTTPAPNLTFSINSGAAALGSFTPSIASTTTTSFSVINYTSFGYVVQLAGKAPTYGTNEIDPMTANAASQPGIEQFGINLVANTSPVSFGANPNNGTAPNDFGFGQAAPNYSTPNQFRYVSGETIAQAPKSSGKTDYTISYLANVATLTQGGAYSSNQTLIVTGTY